jgi:hypothetical protein
MSCIKRLFPFGKFRDYRLQDVDTAYLIHALENFELSEDLIYDINRTLMYKIKAFNLFQSFLEDIIDSSELTYSDEQKQELLASLSNDIQIEELISNFK